MNKTICFVAGGILLLPLSTMAETINVPPATQSTSEQPVSQQQLDELQHDYDKRLSRIEKRLKQTQAATRTIKPNAFNPAIVFILNGNYASYSNNPDDYALPGFALGNEAGLTKEGLSLGESEITMGSNVDQNFYGQATFTLVDNGGETSISAEEAYFETIGLTHGLNAKAGRFYSAMGYINSKHTHAWAFNDAPLVYRGMFGDQLTQDGVQFSWLLPTDQYFLLGGELGNGVQYPSAGGHTGIGDWTAYLKTGGDIDMSNNWQLGVSHWQANNVSNRISQGNSAPSFDGRSRIDAVDVVYKWAPDGNPLQQNFKFQWEYFNRLEDGLLTTTQSNLSSLTGSYAGHQSGWYAQAVYQFVPHWKAGFRYDRLDSNNSGSNAAILDQAGLANSDHIPQRSSVMLAWKASPFSRIRAQYNYDQSTIKTDNQLTIEYTMVMGAHGGHAY